MMPKKSEGCMPFDAGPGCPGFKVEAIVSVDERGQMVLPKDLRKKAQIGAGDKLAIIAWERDGEVCCLSMVKADRFSGMLKDILGPMATELTDD